MGSIGNWVQQYTVTTGTGTITLVGSVPGSAQFSDAIPSGDVWYSIEDGDNREAGLGTFNGVNQLTRTRVDATLVSGVYDDSNPDPINLSGESVVSCTFNSVAYRALADHLALTNNPHEVYAEQVDYDPTDDPTTINTNVQLAMLDHGQSLEQRVPSMSGVISGGVISQTGALTYTVTAGQGEILDNYTDPQNTDITEVSWTTKTDVTLVTGGNLGQSKIFINSVGDLFVLEDPINPSHYRDNILLGIIFHTGTEITEVSNAPSIVKQTATDLYDLLLREFGITGSDVHPVTGALSIYTDEGSIFFPGVNWYVDIRNPNNHSLAQQGSDTVPIEYYPMTQDGAIGAPITVLPKSYNDTGSNLVALSAQQATIHRLLNFGIQDGTRKFILLYGQNVYSNASDARDNLQLDEQNTTYPAQAVASVKLGWLGIGNSATDFDDPDDAWIVSSEISAGGSSGGGGTTDHTVLTGRDQPDQHPQSAITDLTTDLDAKQPIVQSSYNQASDASVGTGTHDIDFADGDMHQVLLTADCVISFSNFVVGKVCTLMIDAINWGAFNVTWPVGTVFEGGTPPELTAAGRDRLLLIKNKDEEYSIAVMMLDIS